MWTNRDYAAHVSRTPSCRAGQNLEGRERQAWAIAEQDYASDVAVARQLRKRYREHLAHVNAEEQAADQAQQDAEKRVIVQACSRHLAPSVAWRNIHRQEARDQQQAAGLKNVLVAEMAFSRLHLKGGRGFRHVTADSTVSPVGGVHGESSRGWHLCPPSVGAISALPSAPRSPDSQPVLQRPKVGSTQCEQLVDSTRDSARLYITDIQPQRQAGGIESTNIPVVSRLRSLLSSTSGL